MDNLVYSVWLSEAIGAENRLYTLLLDEYGDAYNIYCETSFSLPEQFSKAVIRLNKKNLKSALNILDECRNNNIQILMRTDDLYPKRLLSITAPPFLIYAKGKPVPLDDEVCIGVVGTRDISEAGDYAAKYMGFGLAAGGVMVVSGLAQGVDSAAHIGCIGSDGTTIAVLGCGHNIAQRQFNRKLFHRICETGFVISEYSPSTEAKRYTFPQRNRIISGISQAVVVVEAGDKSGALITARYALKQGRPVYAVTNSNGLLDYSGGVMLIEEGANLVRGPEEILAEFELLYPHKISKQRALEAFERRMVSKHHRSGNTEAPVKLQEDRPKTKPKIKKVKEKTAAQKLPATFDESGLGIFEREVCRLVYQNNRITPDEICMALTSDAAAVGSALTSLELSGFIQALPGGLYAPEMID